MAQIALKVAMQRQQPELPWQAHSSPALAQLLHGCFVYEPSGRPSAAEALQLLMQAAGVAVPGPSLSMAASPASSPSSPSSPIKGPIQGPSSKGTAAAGGDIATAASSNADISSLFNELARMPLNITESVPVGPASAPAPLLLPAEQH
jgi:serine/threonine protein kinase